MKTKFKKDGRVKVVMSDIERCMIRNVMIAFKPDVDFTDTDKEVLRLYEGIIEALAIPERPQSHGMGSDLPEMLKPQNG